MINQKIVPHLWFNNEVVDAANFYTTIFPNSKIDSIATIYDTPSGDSSIVNFNISGFKFMGINGGPYFKFNPSISFTVNFNPAKDKKAKENLNTIWNKLLDGGFALMPLQEYPFSKLYGWVQDKYGVSWQLMLTSPSENEISYIVPTLLFVGDVCGKAEEATDYYISIFKNSKRESIYRYPAGMELDKEGSVMTTHFWLAKQLFSAMDSALDHKFNFNEAVSLLISCDTQEEIDYFWNKLSFDPSAEQCGWLKDKYGISWQVNPTIMDEMMKTGTREQLDRVTKAFLSMKKFDIQKLKDAFNGK